MEFGIEYDDGKIIEVFLYPGEDPESVARDELAWAKDQYEQGNLEFAGARIVAREEGEDAWALWTED